MPGSRRRRLVAVWALLCFVLAVRAFAAGLLGGGQVGPPAEPFCVDLNRAGVGELMALPGIGPARAAAIVLHRVRHGPFRSVDALLGVDGIGAATVAALRQHVSAGGS